MRFQNIIFTKHTRITNSYCSQLLKSLLYVFVMLFIFTSSAYAAVYYVDYSDGSDTNNGLSVNSPFKHCPGDDTATNIAGATTLSGGDTVIFKGGVQYDGRIDLDWSGTSGHVITYDGNTAGTWGTGKAIIDGENTRYYGFYSGSTRSYITIDNFEIRDMRSTGVSYGNAGVHIGSTRTSSYYITIRNCHVWDIGAWNTASAAGAGIRINCAENCSIEDNECYRCGHFGIHIPGAKSTTVSGNNIHHYTFWGIDLVGDYRTPTNNIISQNVVHDIYQHNPDYMPGSNVHSDFIYVRRGGGTNPEGTIVEKNLCYNNETFTAYNGTCFIYLSGATNTTVRNNVLINPPSYVSIQTEAISSGSKIYNNTIYAPRPGCYGIRIKEMGAEIKNNILVNGNNNYWTESTTVESNLIADYNLFVDLGCLIGRVGYGCAYADLNNWSSTGQDTHSDSVSTIGAVKFTDTTGYPTTCDTMDLSLQSDSPAVYIAAGADFSLIPPVVIAPIPPRNIRIPD